MSSNLSGPSATSILKGLSGNNGMARCPCHDDRTPSLSISEKNGRVLLKCFAGCSQQAVIGRLREMGLWNSSSEKRSTATPSDHETARTGGTDYERHREMFAILRAAAKADAGQPVEYLKERRINIVPDAAMFLPGSETRRLAGKELWPKSPEGGPTIRLAHGGYPAMILPIATSDGLQGAHVTWLSKDGKTKLNAKERQRQMFGKLKGGFVQLATPDPDKPLIVAEGIETALSAMQIAGVPAIAALSADNLGTITPPKCKYIIIAADNDESGIGEGKAHDAAQSFSTMGHSVRIALPERADGAEKADWNSALQSEAETDDLRAALLNAPDFKIGIEARIDELAKLEPLQYEQQRKAVAEELGLRTSFLDTEVASRRQLPDRVSRFLEPVEPWDEPVDGNTLLYELRQTIERFAILPKGASMAMALWILLSHAHDAATHSPILALSSPTKRCGKTTVLRVLNMLVPKPLPSANVTAATIFRAIERWHPTLLIDEADAFLRDKEDLRGVLDSGHESSQAFVLRCVGEDLVATQFSTWGPKAVAAIGRMHPTLEDRSVVIELRRKLASERVERLPKDLNAFSELRRKCARWATDNLATLRTANPTMPTVLHDRAQDNWYLLLAIADLCGGEWPERARAAALKLSAVDDDETYAIILLEDLRILFETDNRNWASKDIATYLSEFEDRPWPEFSNGKAITPRGVAKLLAPFKIYPKQVRIGGGRINGYSPSQFESAFERYVPKSSDTSDKRDLSKASH